MMTNLQDICHLITDGKHGDCQNEEGSGYYFISCKDVKDGWVDYSGARQITEADYQDTHKRTLLEPNDILITNSGTIGRMVLVPSKPKTYRTTFQKSVAIVKPNSSCVTPQWLYYCLKARKDALVAWAGGTAQKNLLLRDLRAFKVEVPPLPIQRKIACILSAYDNLIENNNRRIRILEEMAQRIYREWFVNFRFPGHEKVKLVESELGMIPEGWEVKKLGDTCNIIMGQSPKSEFYNDRGDGLPFHQGVTNFGSHFPVHKTYCTVQKRLANIGDILFSVRAPVGRINLANSQIILGRGLCGIRNEEEYQCFTLFQLKDRFMKEDIIGGGTIFKSVTKDDMFNIAYIFPGKKLIERFESLAHPMVDEIENLTTKNANLRQTRDLLLPKLISGELDVSELDINVMGDSCG